MGTGIATTAPAILSSEENSNNAKTVAVSVLARTNKERRFRARRPVAGVKFELSEKAGLPAFSTWRNTSIRWRERIHLYW